MTDLPLGTFAYQRSYAEQPQIKLVNRFFEKNPTNQKNQVSLLSRPPTSFFQSVGEGRIRALFSRAGVFDGDLFVVSGDTLYRVDRGTDYVTEIGGTINTLDDVTIDATDTHLWITDGNSLHYYAGDETAATGTLTFTGVPSNDDTLTIGGTVYTWKTTLTGAAYEVLIGSDADECVTNLVAAINADLGEGSTYGLDTLANDFVSAADGTGSTVDVTAKVAGAAGNGILTLESMSNASWGGFVLTGGTDTSISTVSPPSSEAFVGVTVLSFYVIVVVANSQKWFYIEPGETTIEALNFYEAEQIPDEIISVRTIGDSAVFFGTQSTEFWYANGAGDVDDPFSRNQGFAFSRGIIEGTDVLIDNQLIVVSNDGVVRLAGNPEPISERAVEESLRAALVAEKAL